MKTNHEDLKQARAALADGLPHVMLPARVVEALLDDVEEARDSELARLSDYKAHVDTVVAQAEQRAEKQAELAQLFADAEGVPV